MLDLCQAKSRAIVVVNGLPTQGTDAAYLDAKAAVDAMGVAVCQTGICHRKAFVTAVNGGRGITEIASRDKGADEIRALWAELLEVEKAMRKPNKQRTRATKEGSR